MVSTQSLEDLICDGPTVVIGSRVERAPGWHRVVTESMPIPDINIVFRSVFADEREARVRIQETLGDYERRGIRCWWHIMPSARPLHLGELLLEADMRFEFEAHAMWRATDRLEGDADVPGISIEPVGAGNLEDFARACGREPTELSLDWGRRRLAGEWGDVRTFVARLDDGRLAGAAATSVLGDAAFLMSGFTQPQFRGRGVYRALVQARLEQLRAEGIGWVGIHALAGTSSPILQRLGFTRAFSTRTYAMATR